MPEESLKWVEFSSCLRAIQLGSSFDRCSGAPWAWINRKALMWLREFSGHGKCGGIFLGGKDATGDMLRACGGVPVWMAYLLATAWSEMLESFGFSLNDMGIKFE